MLPSLPTHRFLPHQPLTSGTLEALKWLAVLSMTIEHVNRYLLGNAYPVMYHMGRLAMPLFCLVLAYNLARPEAIAGHAAVRVLQRLMLVAVPASLPYLELNFAYGGWLPLNILFTLAAGTACVLLLERPTRLRQVAAILLFGAAGAVVDYGWAGLGLFVSSWYLFRSPSVFWGIALSGFLLWAGAQMQTQWGLVALPVFWLGFYVRVRLPRWRSALYYYYPIHFAVIAVLKILFF